MSTSAAAFHEWVSQFGLEAYSASSVPEDAAFPYLTYVFGTNSWGQGEYAIEVDLWYRGGSEAAPNAICEEISKAIGRGGVQVPCDGGSLWLKRGTPFWQAVADEEDIKRRYINIDVEAFTID